MPAERVIDLLQRWMPEHCDKIHRAGNWIWIIFPEKPSEDVRALLSQMGFHWNGVRKCWQHPCGEFKVRTFIPPRRRRMPRIPDGEQQSGGRAEGGDQP